MATPIDPTQREDYLRLFRSYYKKYLGRDVNEDEISGNLATVEQANAALNGITNSIEYRALASEHPDWFNNDGTLKSGYTNQGAGGGSSTTGGSAPSFTAGMTRDQVRFTLGSPMVTPVFRADQWDYVFYLRKTSGELVERRLSLVFENDQLARWTGDEMPSELPQAADAAPAAKAS